jgi:hypothetical protein
VSTKDSFNFSAPVETFTYDKNAAASPHSLRSPSSQTYR